MSRGMSVIEAGWTKVYKVAPAQRDSTHVCLDDVFDARSGPKKPASEVRGDRRRGARIRG
jgi:hypothetical protein